jgi:hypothetical protein
MSLVDPHANLTDKQIAEKPSTCLNCIRAQWKLSKNGAFHPSGDGTCSWSPPEILLPDDQSTVTGHFFMAGRQAPRPFGGHIDRHAPYHNCPLWQGVGGNAPEGILQAEGDAEHFGVGYVMVTRGIGGVLRYKRIDPQNVFIRADGATVIHPIKESQSTGEQGILTPTGRIVYKKHTRKSENES